MNLGAMAVAIAFFVACKVEGRSPPRTKCAVPAAARAAAGAKIRPPPERPADGFCRASPRIQRTKMKNPEDLSSGLNHLVSNLLRISR